MSFLDNLAATLRNAAITISERAEQFKNQSFADACMAGCALVAMADGVLQPEERLKVVACIQNIRDLHCFKATDLRDSFDNFCRQSGDVFSRVEVVKAIRRVRSDRDQADMVVKIGIIIVKSKGTIADVERTVLREIIHELGLSESDYDLGSTAQAASTASGDAYKVVQLPAAAPTPTPGPARSAAPAVAVAATLPAAAPAPAAVAAAARSAPPQPRKPRVQGSSLKVARAGERISIKQVAGATPSRLLAGFGFDAAANVNLTVSALIFDKDKTLLHRVGYATATAGGVTHNGNVSTTSAFGDDEEIAISLTGIAPETASLVFAIRSANGQPASGVSGAYVRLIDLDKQTQLLRFDLPAPAQTPIALIVGRIYLNNGEWKFAAIGDAVLSGDVEKQLASFA
jgi:tellurite resistance protein TerB